MISDLTALAGRWSLVAHRSSCVAGRSLLIARRLSLVARRSALVVRRSSRCLLCVACRTSRLLPLLRLVWFSFLLFPIVLKKTRCSTSPPGGNQVYPLLLPGPSYPNTDPLTPPKDLKTSPSHSPLPMASKGLLFHAFKVPILGGAFPIAPNKLHAFPD